MATVIITNGVTNPLSPDQGRLSTPELVEFQPRGHYVDPQHVSKHMQALATAEYGNEFLVLNSPGTNRQPMLAAQSFGLATGVSTDNGLHFNTGENVSPQQGLANLTANKGRGVE